MTLEATGILMFGAGFRQLLGGGAYVFVINSLEYDNG